MPWASTLAATGLGVVRRSATAAISTPASFSAIAASRPRSDVVASTAWVPGLTAYSWVRRSAPPDSMTPGRSLPANTSGCSIAPVANTCLRARIWWSVSPCQTGTIPSK